MTICTNLTDTRAAGGARRTEHGTATKADMLVCAEAMVSYIEQNQEVFAGISGLVSCVLNSERTLQIHELESAFQTYGRIACLSQSAGQVHKLFVSLIVQLESIFSVGPSGSIEFKDPHMRTFLHEFRIAGIDTSHSLMALICETALTDFSSETQGSSAFDRTSGKAFLAYAQKHWQLHSSLAATACQSKSQDTSICDDGLLRQLGAVNLDASEDDWIVLKPHQCVNR